MGTTNFVKINGTLLATGKGPQKKNFGDYAKGKIISTDKTVVPGRKSVVSIFTNIPSCQEYKKKK